MTKPCRYFRNGLPLLIVLSLCSCNPAEETKPAEQPEPVPPAVHVHHGIDYIELAVTDMDESKRFYGTAFDWQFNDYGPTYAGIQKQGGEAGGLRLESEVTTGGPLVILYSKDLDRTFARVRDAAVRITKEPFEFPGGRRFQFLDPSGNELAVWSEK